MGSLRKLPPEVVRELKRHVSPAPSRISKKPTPQQSSSSTSGGSNGWVLGGCILFTGGAFSIPFIAQQWIGNLNARDEPLTHAQIRRGAFMNSGSTDAGKDPSWDFRKGEYKKDDNYWAIFDNNNANAAAANTAFGTIVAIGSGSNSNAKQGDEKKKQQEK